MITSTSFLLFLSAFFAGAINSVAGGGTLLTFPLLMALMSPVAANATSTVALLPGTIAGNWGYRRELAAVAKPVRSLCVASLIGGVIGAFLLTHLPGEVFKRAIPWLLLFSAVLFSFRLPIPFLRRKPKNADGLSTEINLKILWPMIFIIAIYGGYFGAAMGILTLAAFNLVGMKDIHQMNAAKTFLTGCTNGIAAVVFIAQGDVQWRYAGLMAGGAILGGYSGATLARRMNRALVQGGVTVLAYALTLYFFLR